MKPFKVLREETVFDMKGRYQIISVDLETPEGDTTTWTYFSLKDGAVIVPIDKEGNTYLKREWRLSRKDFVWEFASGWVDETQNKRIDKEVICSAANRELQEEIGLKADKLVLSKSFYTSNHSDNMFHVVIARGLSVSKLQGDEHEYVEVKKFSLEEARKLLMEDQVSAAQTFIAFYEYEKALKVGV